MRYHYPNIPTDSISYRVNSYVSYLDLQDLLSLSSTIFQLFFIASTIYTFIMDILFMICYIQKRIKPSSDPSSRFHGYLFTLMSEYFTWIFFQPIILTFLSFAACNKDVFDELGISCDYGDAAWLT